jgi:translation initiation factor 2 alpha subunit (eIF-2alpha)
MEIKEDDLVMCTVKKIEGTTVFVEIEGDGAGSIVMSEVAAGRIRNLREYVYPNKKIVCKVLKMLPGNIQLSLRRVTGNEREEMQERYKKERTLIALLKTAVKNYEEALAKVKQKYGLWKFYDNIKENASVLDNFFSKADAQKISKMLIEKKEKDKVAKKEFIIKSFSEEGLFEIKDALNQKRADIAYLGSSRFVISSSGKDFKDANFKIDSVLRDIEKKAKEKKLFFEVKRKQP